ncbi:MAG TPA: heavy metal-associated domain-containing protein [bacterium]|nr:heavy metal-associated domain-containing protein [bacterium]
MGALEELPGVVDAQVNLATKEVRIRYRRDAVTTEAMRRAVERVDLRLRLRHWLHRWATRPREGRPR